MRSVFYDRYGYMKDGWVLIFIIAAIVLLTTGLTVGVVHGVARPSCFEKADGLGVDARWGYRAGCLISEGDGRWFPLDQYRLEVDR